MSTSRILIADSDPETINSLSLRLQADGYLILEACDGLQATRLAMEQQPDLILLQQSLPAGDGHLVYERLGHIETTSAIPIVLLCGSGGTDSDACLIDGVNRCLKAPYETEAVLTVVEANLDRLRQIT